MSQASYNAKVHLAVMCPITSRVKGYPFEVEIPPGLKVARAVLSDHPKSLDWRERRAERIDRMPDEILAGVLARLESLLFS